MGAELLATALAGPAWLLLAATVPGTLYLLLLTTAAWRRPRPGPEGRTTQATPPRVAVVVPAHNEGQALLRTLRSLQAALQGDPHASLTVVADNCSDDTAQVARDAGVQVLERHDTQRRGKGHALEFAFDRLQADWYVVIDADTDVEPGFMAALRRAMRPGVDALQCRYLVRDAMDSRRGVLSEVAWAAWNVLRPRGRANLGLSVGILGNGFALSRATLQRLPYTARSIVEDVEYHLLMVDAGLRVRWVDDTVVRGDMPSAAAAAGTQRARWEGGRLRLALDRVPSLLAASLRGRLRLLDPAADLLLLPLALHVALLSAAALCAALQAGLALGLALGSLAVVALHVFTGLVLIGAGTAHWRALASVPGYIVWKLLLSARIVKAAGRQTEWVRTERAPGPSASRGDTP